MTLAHADRVKNIKNAVENKTWAKEAKIHQRLTFDGKAVTAEDMQVAGANDSMIICEALWRYTTIFKAL